MCPPPGVNTKLSVNSAVLYLFYQSGKFDTVRERRLFYLPFSFVGEFSWLFHLPVRDNRCCGIYPCDSDSYMKINTGKFINNSSRFSVSGKALGKSDVVPQGGKAKTKYNFFTPISPKKKHLKLFLYKDIQAKD